MASRPTARVRAKLAPSYADVFGSACDWRVRLAVVVAVAVAVVVAAVTACVRGVATQNRCGAAAE